MHLEYSLPMQGFPHGGINRKIHIVTIGSTVDVPGSVSVSPSFFEVSYADGGVWGAGGRLRTKRSPTRMASWVFQEAEEGSAWSLELQRGGVR